LELLEAKGRKDILGRAIHPDFTTLRAAPPGALSESGIQVAVAVPTAAAPKLDLLQHPAPPAADAVGQIKPRPSLPAPAVPRTQAPLYLLRPQN
jgi:hypothetical protein